MMKSRIAVVTVAVTFAAAASSFAASPQMGTWKLNEAKSKLVQGMGKTNTVVYAETKDQIKVTVDGVDKEGKKTHGTMSVNMIAASFRSSVSMLTGQRSKRSTR